MIRPLLRTVVLEGRNAGRKGADPGTTDKEYVRRTQGIDLTWGNSEFALILP